MADNTTELEVLNQIVDVLGGQSGQYETVVPVLQQIYTLLEAGITDPEAIAEAVHNELVAHPEWTTTVQDGSITNKKLAGGAVTDAKLAQTGGVLSAVDEISGSTRNIFDPKYLITKAGWTLSYGVYSGTAVKLHQNFNVSPYYPISGFKENTQYTLSFTTYTDGNDSVTGSGIFFYFIYSDGTSDGMNVPNATLSPTDYKKTSASGKTVVGLRVTYGSAGSNIWHLSNVQVEEGLDKSAYIQHLTAVDSTARAAAVSIESEIEEINGKIAWTDTVDVPWEQGNIYMTQSEIYYNTSSADKRIRTPQGYVLALSAGDTINIAAGSSVQMYVSWKTDSGYSYVGWLTQSFTAQVDSEYYILASFTPERVLESVDELSQHITIIRHENARKDITELDTRVTALESRADTSMDVPSYFESSLSSAIATAQTAMLSAGIDGESFVFLSDIHWEANEKHSPALVKAVTSALPIENTIFGGDTFNGGTQAAMVEIMNDVRQRFVKASPHFLSVYGNHDGNQLDGGVAFTNDEFYTYMQKQADYYVSYEAPCYYYMDNEATKTRYIVLDSRTTTPSTASAQLAWLQSITASAGAGWHFIVFCHVIFYPDSSGSWTDPTTWVMSQFMTDVLAALDAVNTGGSSKVEAIFGGHCHRDYNTQTQGGIPIVLIDCDTKQTVSGNPQTAGTVNEQCLDIVTVNYSTETITCARIGRGTSRTISY